jgi:hypothetical protein
MSRPDPLTPNFFVAGVPKAGTTSLYYYLDQHPQIYMSPIKEPAYFSLELRLENFGADMEEQTRRDMPALREYLDGPMSTKRFGGPVTEWEDYLRLYRGVRDEIAIGEASVCYLWSQTAPQRIAERVPEAKILVILRDPAERAFSHYLQAVGLGITQGTLREYIEEDLRCRTTKFTLRHPFLAWGNYAEQVKRYRNQFPPRNMRMFLYEDYSRNAPAVLRQIFEFLSVDPAFLPDTKLRHLEPRLLRFEGTRSIMTVEGRWQSLRKVVPPAIRHALRPMLLRERSEQRMEPADRALLVEYYRDNIRETARLLDRDLSPWLLPDR